MKRKYRVNLLKLGQTGCLLLTAFYLEWALWSDFSFSNRIFQIGCIGGFALIFLYAAPKVQEIKWKKVMPEYMHYLIWIAIMAIAYGFFYSTHSKISFIFITGDAYAIFFIRLLVSVIPFMFFVDQNNFKETKLFKLILAAVIGTNAFYTFRAVQFFPDAIRARATMEYIGAEEFLFATPDYPMVYGMALIFPVFLQKVKNAQTRFDRILYLIFTALIFYVLLVSQFATALLIAIIGGLLFFLFSMRGNRRVMVLIVVSFVVLYVHVTKMDVAILNFLADSIEGTWSGKLHDIALSISGSSLSGSVSDRTDLYQKSIKTFLESPIFGIMAHPTGSLGGHATAIDILGLTGIFGFIPFALTIFYNFKRVCRTCNFPKNKAAIITCHIEFIVLVFSKNIITSLSLFFAFFVLVPLLLKVENTDERK